MYKSLRIEITGRCNLKCLYCQAARLNNPVAIASELQTERILTLIDEAKILGCTEFTLIGGEPFLNQDWPVIVEKCGKDSVVNITTNGHFFGERTIAKIRELPQIQEFRISLDGLISHDVVRKGSNHKQLLATIAKMILLFPDRRIVVQTTCNRQNLPELLNLYHELKRIGIFRWYIGQLGRFGRTKENEGLLEFADYDDMFVVYRELIQTFHVDGKPFRLSIYNVYNSQITAEDYIEMDLNTHPCLYYFGVICVRASGELTFCPILDLPFASVKNQSLNDALKAPRLTEFKQITTRSVFCSNCRYIKLCGGGCRADAFAWLGDIKELDPVSCSLMARVERDIVPILADDEQSKYHSLTNYRGDAPPVAGRNIEEAVRFWQQLKERR